MRLLALGLLALVALAAIVQGLAQLARPAAAAPVALVTSTGPTLEKLEALQDLAVQKVTVADILTYTEGPVSASWLIKGDGLISVPLRSAKIENVDPQARTAKIRLPSPTVLSARVDHERTAFWDTKQGLWNRMNPWGKSVQDVHTHAMRAAQRLVEHAVDSPENLQQARVAAAAVITRLYGELGWSVTIEWIEAEPSLPRAPLADPGTVPHPPQRSSGYREPLPATTSPGSRLVAAQGRSKPPSLGTPAR
jgi:hypothetical protein